MLWHNKGQYQDILTKWLRLQDNSQISGQLGLLYNKCHKTTQNSVQEGTLRHSQCVRSRWLTNTDGCTPSAGDTRGGYLDLDRRPLLDAEDEDELEESASERERCSCSPDAAFLLSFVLSSSSSSSLYLDTSTSSSSSCTTIHTTCHSNAPQRTPFVCHLRQYKSFAPRSSQITTPVPHHSVFTGWILWRQKWVHVLDSNPVSRLGLRAATWKRSTLLKWLLWTSVLLVLSLISL